MPAVHNRHDAVGTVPPPAAPSPLMGGGVRTVSTDISGNTRVRALWPTDGFVVTDW